MEEEKTPEKVLDEIKTEDKEKPKNNPKLNKQLAYILVGIGIAVIITLAMPYLINLTKQFNYKGVRFKVIKQGELTFYNTQIPLYNSSGKKYSNYNFYLRNDPRNLENIPFNGKLYFKKNMVINATQDFTKCDKYSVIAFANLAQLYAVMGTKVIKDLNASCDAQGRYTYLNVKTGNETKIEQVGPSCYDLIVSNCEVLNITERFMDETFIKINNETKISA